MKKIMSGIALILFALSANAQHIVTLKSGEKMSGKVQALKDGVISFDFKGNIMKLNVSDVISVSFNSQAETPKSSNNEAGRKDPGEKQITSGSYLIRYKVADRNMVRTPQVSNLTQEKGTVVVEIAVNKYGNVVKAEPGSRGSTTTSNYLLTKAKQAAESAVFDNIPTAPLQQTGYMIIAF